MRESFIFYRSFYEAISDLPDQDQAVIFRAICKYSLDHQEPELTGIPGTIFKLIRPQLEANYKRYENGKQPKSKQSKSEPEAKQKQTGSKPEGNKNVNDNVNENKNKNDNDNLLIPIGMDLVSENSDLEKAYKDFIQMRKKMKKPPTEKAEEMIKTKLKKMAGDDYSLAVEILNQSTYNNWIDIYPLKTDRTVKSEKGDQIIDAARGAIESIFNKK